MAAKLLLFFLIFYAALVAIAFLAQTHLLFPARLAAAGGPPPPGSERIELETADGHRLHGLLIPPRAEAAERLLVIGFGGNAWNAEAAAAYLAELYPEAHVAAFHYRGYGSSAGRPSAAALLADAAPVHDAVRERVRPERTVAAGFSIGGGVAARLAAERPIDGLILVTPFDSLHALAAGHYRWLPVRLLLRHRMEPARELAGRDLPVAILAAARDSIVPAARTDALRRAVPNLAFDRTIAGAGHNDLYQQPAFRAAMREAMAAVLGRGG